MKRILLIFVILFFLVATTFPQSRFDFDCYQKYKKCIKENKEAKIPCYFEFCNFEQCICKETKVINPITHHEDTDPGAWGTAITVCSPWAQSISQCIDNYYKENGDNDCKTSSKLKTLTLKTINKLKELKTKIKRFKKRGKGLNDFEKKIEKQIKLLENAIKDK